MTQEGVLIVTAREHRTQEGNRAEDRARFTELVGRAEIKPKRRRPRRPAESSKRKRLAEKAQRSSAKKLPGQPREE